MLDCNLYVKIFFKTEPCDFVYISYRKYDRNAYLIDNEFCPYTKRFKVCSKDVMKPKRITLTKQFDNFYFVIKKRKFFSILNMNSFVWDLRNGIKITIGSMVSLILKQVVCPHFYTRFLVFRFFPKFSKRCCYGNKCAVQTLHTKMWIHNRMHFDYWTE